MKHKKQVWWKNFWIILGITIANFFIPDPLPVIDEIILIGWATLLGIGKL